MKMKELFSLQSYGVVNKAERSAYVWSFTLAGTMAAILGAIWQRLPTRVPLYFSNPWGAERLAQSYMLFLIPVFGVAVTLLNLFFGKRLGKHSDILVPSLSIAALTINIMLVISIIGIIRSIV